jgi:hypothetical protein
MQHYNYRTAVLTAVYKTEHGPFLNNNKKNGNMTTPRLLACDSFSL